MSTEFREIQAEEIQDNPFKLIGSDWMLITAGTLESYNTMTASWGGLGTLWDRHVCFCFVRPTRHTYQFMEKAEDFTLSFFDESHRKALSFCGAHSGRDVNKAAKTGLVPVAGAAGSVYFAQARLVLECRKLYFQDLDRANFLDKTLNDFYSAQDHHRLYIGEVCRCLAH